MKNRILLTVGFFWLLGNSSGCQICEEREIAQIGEQITQGSLSSSEDFTEYDVFFRCPTYIIEPLTENNPGVEFFNDMLFFHHQFSDYAISALLVYDEDFLDELLKLECIEEIPEIDFSRQTPVFLSLESSVGCDEKMDIGLFKNTSDELFLKIEATFTPDLDNPCELIIGKIVIIDTIEPINFEYSLSTTCK